MERKNKKIIFSANTSWYLWNFRGGLMRALKSDGYEIITMSSSGEYSERLAKEFLFQEVSGLNRTGANPFQDIILFFRYVFLFHKLKPDLVVSATIKPNIYGSLACRLLGIPAISTITGLGHAFSQDNWMQALISFLYRISFQKVKKVLFQNPDDQELFLQREIISVDKTKLVPGSGADTARFFHAPLLHHGDRITFLLIARLLRDKGVYLFAEAAEHLRKEFPHTSFLLAGPLDEKNPTCIKREEIENWKAQGILDYLGTIDDVVPVMARSEVMVLPTWYREGIPKSLLEAMAMGRPIITTDVSGCRLTVNDGENGYLIEPKSGEALITAMRHIINLSQEDFEAMGNKSRELAIAKFDEKIIFDIHRKMIREIIG